MAQEHTAQKPTAPESSGIVASMLDWIERIGNKLPDPAILFVISLFIVWILSIALSGVSFDAVDPRTNDPIQINNLLTGTAFVTFLSQMVGIFTGFAPLGVVLVAMLGVGVAEHSGYINAGLKLMLSFVPRSLLTPMVIMVGIVSHTAVDAGYVLVIPLGGVIFHAAGRHPLAGIAAAFAGVSGGFSANFVPSAIDPLLQGFTQTAAQILDPAVQVNPLCNYYFTSASGVVIMLLGWFLTDKIIEPRLAQSPVDADADAAPKMDNLSSKEKKAFVIATTVMIIGLVIVLATVVPAGSPWREPNSGKWDNFAAPIMQSIVPLIFLLFLIPGLIYGFISASIKKSKDMVDQMSKSMGSMAYYIVMAFFCALFIYAFSTSNLGTLIAVKGADGLKALNLPGGVTIAGIIFLTAMVNLVVGSASAKWALLGPIFIPILMQVGISPELTQAAYRVGDSSSNIITPLMPYFPLVVVFCQKYVKKTGIGTLVSMMLPYCIVFLICWTIFLLIFWGLGLPLGLSASYTYPAS